jgi:hypothetical protein
MLEHRKTETAMAVWGGPHDAHMNIWRGFVWGTFVFEGVEKRE